MTATKRKVAEIYESCKSDTIQELESVVSTIHNSLADDYMLKIKQENKGSEKITILYFTSLDYTNGHIGIVEHQLLSILYGRITNTNQDCFELWHKNGCHFQNDLDCGCFSFIKPSICGVFLACNKVLILNLSQNSKTTVTDREKAALSSCLKICPITNQIIQE